MKTIRDYWPIIASLVAAAMWLGALQQRVATLEQRDHYVHGNYQVPESK